MRGRNIARISVFAGLAAIVVLFALPLHRADATINRQINFQGKLTNPDGTNVTNGSYSIRFRIYTSTAPTDATNTCLPGSNSCKWEETQGTVAVADGIFQVSLGSVTALPGSVDFNVSGLYLGIKVGADAEMTPRVQFTAAPYAFNTDLLDGIDSTGLVQLGQSASAQTDASTNSSIFINKTAAGNLLQLQASATNLLTLSSAGALALTGSITTSGGAISLTGNAASSISTTTGALTLTGAAASTWSTTAGNLTIQAGSGTVSLGSSTVLTANGAVTVNSGAATTLTLDSGTTGAINIGNSANAKTIAIGNFTGATTVGVDVGTATNAFNIQGPGSTSMFQIDTTNNRIYVGNPTADATAVTLVLDSKNTTGDPTAVNGSEYYNSANNKFRCYQNSIWQDCGNGFNTITKAADQAATQSSTTFQNDNTLSFSANANTTYAFDAWIPVNDSNATADLKYTFTTPAGATLNIAAASYSTATANIFCNIIASAQTCATTVNSAVNIIQARGYVTVGGTAGTIQFQFAQNTSTAASFPVIKKGATLSWHQSN